MAASDVVVSHGGNGTVYQALSRGVPIIGFPTIFDQEINMRRVGALGVGVGASRTRYTGASLESAVRRILGDPTYRERCQTLEARIAQMDGRRRAALHIDDFIEHHDPTQHPTTTTDTLRALATSPAQIASA
jgi:UDP:flavonoid glycosyltransferase YjiC (YdhE family)